MLCRKPVMLPGKAAVSCGQCMPCRVHKRREWTARILLELTQHKLSTFLTLTYAEEHLPENGTLVPEHVQLFLKRLRKKYDKPIRYFLCGEYGDASERPHYHLALFGYPNCFKGRTHRRRSGHCCDPCDRVQQLWRYGLTYAGDLSEQSAAYIAGYVTKKLTRADDERLNGRHPEFARMSLRPGIGAYFADEIADRLLRHDLEDVIPDVPTSVAIGKREMPIGKYIRRKVRERIGRDVKAPEAVILEAQKEVRDLWSHIESVAPKAPLRVKESWVKNELLDRGAVKALRLERNLKRQKKVVL